MLDRLAAAAHFIQSIKQTGAKVGIMMASGSDLFISTIEDKTIIPYGDIPYFLETTDPTHRGELILGHLGGIELAVLHGRLHLHEGHSIDDVVFPIRTLCTLGITTLILGNCAGGINENFNSGDLVLISDHINLSTVSPLTGLHIKELGNNFPDMRTLYDKRLRQHLLESAQEIGYHLKEGVYAFMMGPNFETPAEVRVLKMLGADLVGLSIVPEAIAARHLGVPVVALSCITNNSLQKPVGQLLYEDIESQKQKITKIFNQLMQQLLVKIAKD